MGIEYPKEMNWRVVLAVLLLGWLQSVLGMSLRYTLEKSFEESLKKANHTLILVTKRWCSLSDRIEHNFAKFTKNFSKRFPGTSVSFIVIKRNDNKIPLGPLGLVSTPSLHYHHGGRFVQFVGDWRLSGLHEWFLVRFQKAITKVRANDVLLFSLKTLDYVVVFFGDESSPLYVALEEAAMRLRHTDIVFLNAAGLLHGEETRVRAFSYGFGTNFTGEARADDLIQWLETYRFFPKAFPNEHNLQEILFITRKPLLALISEKSVNVSNESAAIVSARASFTQRTGKIVYQMDLTNKDAVIHQLGPFINLTYWPETQLLFILPASDGIKSHPLAAGLPIDEHHVFEFLSNWTKGHFYSPPDPFNVTFLAVQKPIETYEDLTKLINETDFEKRKLVILYTAFHCVQCREIEGKFNDLIKKLRDKGVKETKYTFGMIDAFDNDIPGVEEVPFVRVYSSPSDYKEQFGLSSSSLEHFVTG
eukprot:TRINITY_DN10330_c0_g2_i1.p1 TRINITY_DN10330_c0_g2~~TRINITY_DN10330_c0_g2_i1.p1  ORF type:complete len:489 (+),score=99.51 TRINITY_DN10330_c0_g2_i1:41-1468(+)